MCAVLHLQNTEVIEIQWLREIILRWAHDCLHLDLDTCYSAHVGTWLHPPGPRNPWFSTCGNMIASTCDRTLMRKHRWTHDCIHHQQDTCVTALCHTLTGKGASSLTAKHQAVTHTKKYGLLCRPTFSNWGGILPPGKVVFGPFGKTHSSLMIIILLLPSVFQKCNIYATKQTRRFRGHPIKI